MTFWVLIAGLCACSQESKDPCSQVTAEDLNRFRVIFCAGSSNSYLDSQGDPPHTEADLADWYHGMIVKKVKERFAACIDFEPVLWVHHYSEVGEVQPDTTLSWSIDAFFHFLDDEPGPEIFRQRVSDYLDTLFGGMNDGVVFVGANIPRIMMLLSREEEDLVLSIIEEEMAKRPNTILIDLEWYMDNLLLGNVYYDGEPLSFLDIFEDFLHLNVFGQQVMADIVIMALNERWPNLQLSTGRKALRWPFHGRRTSMAAPRPFHPRFGPLGKQWVV